MTEMPYEEVKVRYCAHGYKRMCRKALGQIVESTESTVEQKIEAINMLSQISNQELFPHGVMGKRAPRTERLKQHVVVLSDLKEKLEGK